MDETTRKTRAHDFEIEVDASPEVVWEAVTRAEGITSWFAPEARVEPGEGGSITLAWGEMAGTAPVTVWDPPRRVAWREGPAESPKVVEFRIEGEGGKTRLRLVHSGFGEGASFEDEYDATYSGWMMFLALLKNYLSRYAGGPTANVSFTRMMKASRDAVFGRLAELLSIESDWKEGGAWRAVLPGAGPSAGHLLRRPSPGYAALAHENGVLGLFVEGFGGAVMVTVTWYLYGPAAARAAELREAWAPVVASLAAGFEKETLAQ